MFLRRLYSIWVILSLAVFFFIFIIPQLMCAPFKRLHRVALKINHWWAVGFFKLAFIPVKETWHFTLEKNQQYILCANHFSYLDIPALGLFPRPFKFVGKSQLRRIPLFGYMYNKIHITVNRSSYRSRAQSLLKARDEMRNGFNLGFFPEGGIRVKEYPQMVEFKDGAFRIAAENNIPIIPISFPDNFKILKDDKIMQMKHHECRIIYHEPIHPEGATEAHIKQLRDKVFRVIQDELHRN